VKSYRIYLVSKDGRLRLGDAFDAAADGDAVERARAAATPGEAVELWEGGRMVGAISPEGVFTSQGGPRTT
jgi:hypothetical protein